jgi:hypothetical protein
MHIGWPVAAGRYGIGPMVMPVGALPTARALPTVRNVERLIFVTVLSL